MTNGQRLVERWYGTENADLADAIDQLILETRERERQLLAARVEALETPALSEVSREAIMRLSHISVYRATFAACRGYIAKFLEDLKD